MEIPEHKEAARGSKPMRPQRKYGIIVFGATGFTGKRVLVEMASSGETEAGTL